MTTSTRRKVFTFLVVPLISLSAMAASIKSIDFDKSTEVNKAHKISFVFEGEPNSINCGMSIDWGDGESKKLRFGKDLDIKPPFQVSHTYGKVGIKIIKIEGAIIFRGLGTVGPCMADLKDQIEVRDAALVVHSSGPKAPQARTEKESLQAISAPTAVVMVSEVATGLAASKDAKPDLGGVAPKNTDEASQLEAEVKERLWKQSPEYKALQEKKLTDQTATDSLVMNNRADAAALARDAEKARLLEEKLASEKAKKEHAEASILAKEAEKKRLVEERAAAEKTKKEQAEAAVLARVTEMKRLAEERERTQREKKEQAEAAVLTKELERKRVIEERAAAAIEKKEQAEAVKRQAIEAKERSEADKRRSIEAALMRPLINNADPRLSCQSSWEYDSRFESLKEKISLSGLTDLSFPMLSNQTMPSAKEQKIISELAAEFKKCISQSQNYRNSNYSREVNSILEREDAGFLDAAIDLYAKKINYGNYNYKVQKIANESRTSLKLLEQNINFERAAAEAAERTRASVLREAQIRQNEQSKAEQRRQDQMRQAEQARIASVRRQWVARCEFEKRNAQEKYSRSKENTCNGASSKGLAFLCVIGNISAEEDYANSAYESCMSGAPN